MKIKVINMTLGKSNRYALPRGAWERERSLRDNIEVKYE